MTRFDELIDIVLDGLARDQKDVRNRKIVSDALLSAYKEGKADGVKVKQERLAEILEGLKETAMR